MENEQLIDTFLSGFPQTVAENSLLLRDVLLKRLPEIQVQLDIPAKMMAFSYGKRYTDMVCTLIPSQKEVKLGFYKGVDLPDPEKLLKGAGKLSRYVQIKKQEDIYADALAMLIKEAFKAYKKRVDL